MRFGDDLLASASRMAVGGRLAASPRTIIVLAHLHAADQIDWSRAVVDSASVRAVGGGKKTGPNPTDRGKPGSKHHVLTDAAGVLLAATVTGAYRHDVTQLVPLLEAIPPVRGRRGRPRTGGRRRCMATGRMTRRRIGKPCESGVSIRYWCRAASRTAAAWGIPMGRRTHVGLVASIPSIADAL